MTEKKIDEPGDLKHGSAGEHLEDYPHSQSEFLRAPRAPDVISAFIEGAGISGEYLSCGSG